STVFTISRRQYKLPTCTLLDVAVVAVVTGLSLLVLFIMYCCLFLRVPLICSRFVWFRVFFFFQAEDGIRDWSVTGVQTCALPICSISRASLLLAPSRRHAAWC